METEMETEIRLGFPKSRGPFLGSLHWYKKGAGMLRSIVVSPYMEAAIRECKQPIVFLTVSPHAQPLRPRDAPSSASINTTRPEKQMSSILFGDTMVSN